MIASRSAASRPLVIAHRGASGHRPEHTRAAYDLAIDQGADFIEPDLVMSRDGVLVVRHDLTLNESTDVPQRPEFADRWALKQVDGRPVSGWFAEDFTLAELKSLRAREPIPALRPASEAWPERLEILTFDEVVAIAKAGSARTGRTVGIYPELKHPSYLESLGFGPEAALLAVLEREGWTGPDAPVFVQCFEVGPLERLRALAGTRSIQLIGPAELPADRPDVTAWDMVSPDGLARIATYADGVGVEKSLAVPRGLDGRLEPPAPLIADAHAVGLVVHAWTFRAENFFLPEDMRRGVEPAVHGDLAAELRAFVEAGVDGVFCDHPDMAVAALGRV